MRNPVYLSSDAGGYCARRRLLITMEYDFMFSSLTLNGTLNEDRSCPASSGPYSVLAIPI